MMREQLRGSAKDILMYYLTAQRTQQNYCSIITCKLAFLALLTVYVNVWAKLLMLAVQSVSCFPARCRLQASLSGWVIIFSSVALYGISGNIGSKTFSWCCDILSGRLFSLIIWHRTNVVTTKRTTIFSTLPVLIRVTQNRDVSEACWSRTISCRVV